MLSNCSASILRLVYEGKVSKGKEILWSYPWYLTALKEENDIIDAWKFWKRYKLSIWFLVDIRESDSILIDWISYAVKGVTQRHWWNLALTTVILEKWV
jgi:hypothetical protein